MLTRGIVVFSCFLCFCITVVAQPPKGIHWTKDGSGYYESDGSAIVLHSLPGDIKKPVVAKSKLIPAGSSAALKVRNFFFSQDGKKVLIYTNSERVWRYDTKGDYWVLDLASNKLAQIGKSLPVSSLMFAKFSPDASQVAYVSAHNIYVEDVTTNKITQLTKDGTDRLINGTFDWAYEEEFGCIDGFRWSPDGKSIAYWQIDATRIRNFLMINNTDSIYSYTIPVEYPKVGESPSACKIAVIDLASQKTTWMNVPGDAQQHYIPRMEWAANSTELILQQLNRKQNESKIMLCNAKSGDTKEIYSESDKAWIDIKERWNDGDPAGWEWLNDGKSFLWVSEKDGWRHIYIVSRDGKKETLVTKGDYDIITIKAIDDKSGFVYFMASPGNATQQYLYRTKLDGTGEKQLLSPGVQAGTHEYDVSPNGAFAEHKFSNANFEGFKEWVSLPAHQSLDGGSNKYDSSLVPQNVKFFQVTTEDNVTLDGWIVKPTNFDSTKKYPVVFFVYTEPASQTVTDSWGAADDFLYAGDMPGDGYIYISLDGRGTPAPKGTAWRKAIYRKVGMVNIQDQAMAAKKILQLPYMDTSRVAVWGWSGGASTTLNLLFRYPEIYKTGIAVAAVANQLTYDNIYQERYMGVPQENKEDFITGSPITYAKNLQGHLLYIHGTGDDNVHYQNAEMLINELVKYNKQFQLMIYPNRSHGLSEGEGTFRHLATLYTTFLQTWCPPGPR
ncbi:MAG: S9 family peptidase [Panacibacter sp.]